ncbi:MAG: AAA family ATPase [Paludibacteraceae bacterium]
MILNLGSLSFNANLLGGGGTPAWGTELGQGEGYKFSFENLSDFFTGMVYKAIKDIDQVKCPLGKGGNQSGDYEFVIASLFDKIFVNGKRIPEVRFLLLIVKKIVGEHHVGRRSIKYNPRMSYRGEYINEQCYSRIPKELGWDDNCSWFIHEINIVNQDELHFTAYQLDENPITYVSTEERKNAYLSRLPKSGNYKLGRNLDFDITEPTQVIYFGAPGTGKSHTIKAFTNKLPEDNVFRTTFHPDSDYSTFVGSYKPTKEKRPVRNVAGDIVKQNGQEVYEDTITYNYIPQAFTKAYIRAWQIEEPVFLVIEEINRGNCAQIFGDLFQLLDRKDNVSEYPIKPDTDLGNFVHECFEKEGHLAQIPTKVLSGEELCLPANLYIWATMNTSDQSLFPIDSAFKRRWEWRYIKIAKPNNKETGNPYDWNIEGNIDWWQFLKQINCIINQMTNSADKQLGYFFAKADDAGIIKYERFVAKVCFYLWNDIFKTYSMDDVESNLFMYTYEENGQSKTAKLNFTEFFDEDGKVVPNIVQQFIDNVMKWNNNTKQE